MTNVLNDFTNSVLSSKRSRHAIQPNRCFHILKLIFRMLFMRHINLKKQVLTPQSPRLTFYYRHHVMYSCSVQKPARNKFVVTSSMSRTLLPHALLKSALAASSAIGAALPVWSATISRRLNLADSLTVGEGAWLQLGAPRTTVIWRVSKAPVLRESKVVSRGKKVAAWGGGC